MANKDEIAFLALTTFRNQKKRFGIKIDDRRRHIYIVGKTGMGKTALMENLVIQDIQAGRGVAFIDPHGEASEKILNHIPSKRINDVIYFNPADIDFPITFNVMEQVKGEQRHLVASGLMGVFKKIWPDVWSARMEYILNNCFLALLEYPNSTLLGVNRMLADPDYRKKVVEKVTDPVVKSFWTQEFARYTQRYEVEATAAIQNKVGQFISAPIVRNIIGQVASKIDMRAIMDEGKILIANLAKGRIGEDNSRLLGALLTTKLQLAAMSRVDIPEEERKDFYLYVDEFQNFATEAFCNILSEARKYRLCLTLANQYLTQLEEMTPTGKSSRVKDAVFGNVGTMIIFRVGAEDAEFLEKELMPEFLATDLVNLAKYNIYIKLMIDGVASRAFSAQTLPPVPLVEDSSKETIITISRERYGTPRKFIEEKIARWTGIDIPAIPDSTPVQAKNPSGTSVLYDAQCSSCKKWTKVVFQPDGKRPVYCKSCLKKPEKNEGDKSDKSMSLNEAFKKEPIPFSVPKMPKEKRERDKKTVNLGELKKVLSEGLANDNQNKENENN